MVKTAGLAVLRESLHRTRVWSVTAVWLRFSAEMRARWRAWLALAVFAGVTCGVVIALAAASARTASAYHRYLVASNHADAYVDPGFAFGGDESLDLGRIARLPEVEAAERTAMPFVIAKSASGRSIYPSGPAAVQFMAPMDGRSRDTIDRQKVLRGREPDPRRPDEALLDSKAARALGVDVGDSITLRLAWGEASGKNSDLVLTADPRTATVGPLVTVRVVGVSANSRASVDAGVVHLSPGFYAAHGGAKLVVFLYELETRLVHREADLKRFEADVQRIAGKRRYGFFEANEGRLDVQASIDTLAQALRIVTVIAGVAALLLVGQALIRQALVDAASRRVLRALGMTRGGLVGLAAARALAVALPAAVLAVLVAYALSPLAPIGWARELEPDPGLSFAAPTLLAGGILVLATMLLVGVLAGAWAMRPERPRTTVEGAAALARAELPPAMAAGLRMALVRRGAAAGVPVRTTLVAAVVAVCVGVTALVFAASLQHLLDTPRLFGRTWDFEISGGGPPLGYDVLQALTTDPGIAAVAMGRSGPLSWTAAPPPPTRWTTSRARSCRQCCPVARRGPPTRSSSATWPPGGSGSNSATRCESVAVPIASDSSRGRVVPGSKWGKLGEGVALQFRALSGSSRRPGELGGDPCSGDQPRGNDRPPAGARGGPSNAVTPVRGHQLRRRLRASVPIAAVSGAVAAALATRCSRRCEPPARPRRAQDARLHPPAGHGTIACQATTIAAVGLLIGLPLGLGTPATPGCVRQRPRRRPRGGLPFGPNC